MYHSIRPGQPWLDTNGKRIQAHGGSVIYIDGVYYFYGENKEKNDGTTPAAKRAMEEYLAARAFLLGGGAI